MSPSGSPYARFRRALASGSLPLVHAAAAELPQVDTPDALRICLLMSAQDDDRFERAAVRWLARVSLETPSIRLDDLRAGLVAFEAMPYNPAAARQTLAQLCSQHHLDASVRVLTDPASG